MPFDVCLELNLPLYNPPLYIKMTPPFKEISRACKPPPLYKGGGGQGMLHWFYLNITVTKMLLNFFKCWSKSFFFKSSSDLWMSPKKTKSSQTLKKTEKRKYQFLSISNLKKSNAKPKRDFGVNFMKFHKNVVRYMHVFLRKDAWLCQFLSKFNRQIPNY